MSDRRRLMERIEDHTNGHKYIDLGLSVLWATMNVGAESETEIGDYYRFGAGANKASETSNFRSGNNETLPLEYDTARQVWGGKWRMPTKDESLELSLRDGAWVSQQVVDNRNGSGVKGFLITGRVGEIFFPIDQYCYWYSQYYQYRTSGNVTNVWTSTNTSSAPIMFGTGGFQGSWSSTMSTQSSVGGYVGIHIRPVLDIQYA